MEAGFVRVDSMAEGEWLGGCIVAESPASSRSLSEKDWAEGVGTLAKKSQTGAAIRVCWNKAQLDSGDLPEKAKPDEQPHVPAQEDELQDGDADENVPETGRGKVPASPRQGVPCRDFDGNSALPQPQAKSVDKSQETNLGGDGIAKPDSRFNCLVKTGQVLRQDDAPLDKSTHYRTDTRMNKDFGPDENRKCDEESHMYFNIVKEGKLTNTPSREAQGGEEQQRQPCD